MNNGRHLHIVSFNLPEPPNYGSVIDIFYKIKALHSLGIKIHLHCFSKEKTSNLELEKYCDSIHFYEQKKFYQAIYSSVPYVVGTRKSGELLSNLSQDNYPVLFEGLHTCFYLSHPSLKDRVKAVRTQPVEWEYYKSLGNAERNYLLKFYYNYELNKLKKYQQELVNANKIFVMNQADYQSLRPIYEEVYFIPPFHSNEAVTIQPGKGTYILYHGNLGLVENIQAAVYIIKKIAADSPFQFIIAGKNPAEVLKKEIAKSSNIKLVANPTHEEMIKLIEGAQINLLNTFQPSGIKLKLLNSLYRGRFCLVNSKMVDSTGLEEACIIEDNPNITKKHIATLMESEFSAEDLRKRKEILEKNYHITIGAQKIIEQLFV